jgi:CheY-like chemotaxis protein
MATVSGRVLIVDDDERQQIGLAAMLSDRHLEIQAAGDGLEALERLAAFNPDVIVADLVMPQTQQKTTPWLPASLSFSRHEEVPALSAPLSGSQP